MSLRIFRSNKPNTLHYITAVTNSRRTLFREDEICNIFIDVVKEIKEIHPFKLIGYVIMPDHTHFIINPLRPEISTILRKIKGKSAKLIIDFLKESGRHMELKWLEIGIKNRKYAVWQKKSPNIDLISEKFIRQKLRYIHMNPVKAGLCKHPSDWKWSSYRSYQRECSGEIPLEIDEQRFWTESELQSSGADSFRV